MKSPWKLSYTLVIVAAAALLAVFATWYLTRRDPTKETLIQEATEQSPQPAEPEPVSPKAPPKPIAPLNPRALRVGENQPFATLQAAIDAAPDGSHIVIAEGEYVSNTAIMISGKKNLTIKGEGVVSLLLGDKDSNVIEVEKSSNIRFENLKVKHTDPPPGDRCSGYVFQVVDSQNFAIVDSDINGSGLVGLVAGGVDGILLENNIFHDNQDEGVYIYSSRGTVRMYNNRFEENGAHVSFNFEPVSENLNRRGLEMSGNEFLSTRPFAHP